MARMSETLPAAVTNAAIAEWTATEPRAVDDYDRNVAGFGAFWRDADTLLRRLPPKPQRNGEEAVAAATILAEARQSRERFLTVHAERVYDRLTDDRSRFVRVDELVFRAAEAVPGLAPAREQVAAEAGLDQG